jgi:hypothetical protein
MIKMAYVGFIAVFLSWLYVIYSVMRIKADIDEMRHTMLDILVEEKQRYYGCMEGWKDTIEKFDDSVKLTNEMLEVLKQESDWISCDDRVPELYKEGEQDD